MEPSIINDIPNVFQDNQNFITDPVFKELFYNQRKILDNQDKLIALLENQTQLKSVRKAPTKDIADDKAELALETLKIWNDFCLSEYGKDYKLKLITLALKNKKLVDNISVRFNQEGFDYKTIIEIMKLHPLTLRPSIGFDFIFESPNKWPKILEGKYVDHSSTAQSRWEKIKQKIHEISVPDNLSNIIKGAFS